MFQLQLEKLRHCKALLEASVSQYKFTDGQMVVEDIHRVPRMQKSLMT